MWSLVLPLAKTYVLRYCGHGAQVELWVTLVMASDISDSVGPFVWCMNSEAFAVPHAC